MTGAVDAHESINIAIIDVENAFLQSEPDQMIIMAIHGKAAELLVRLNPELHRPYILSVWGQLINYAWVKY